MFRESIVALLRLNHVHLNFIYDLISSIGREDSIRSRFNSHGDLLEQFPNLPKQ